MDPIQAKKAFFIKLGTRGMWEKECLQNGTLRLGYNEVPHELCITRDWERARAESAFREDADQGAITRHIKQVKRFYLEPETTLWITFHADRMWWCFAKPEVELRSDNTKTRNVADKWSSTDITGKDLIKDELSGKLLAVQSFQGTICAVSAIEYLIHKINGTYEPHVKAAESSRDKLIEALIPIIKNLHAKDLEILTDLIFRQSGWQRTGVAGEVEKDIDLSLQSPITGDRIGVQIKSKATLTTFEKYKDAFSEMNGYAQFYFVTHSPDKSLVALEIESSQKSNFVFWGPKKLAELTVRSGLTDWLLDKIGS